MPHILLNFYGINDGKDLDLTAPTVQCMSSSSLFPFAVFLDWRKTWSYKIMAPRLKHESLSWIGSVPSNYSRTDSIFFEWSFTLYKLPLFHKDPNRILKSRQFAQKSQPRNFWIYGRICMEALHSNQLILKFHMGKWLTVRYFYYDNIILDASQLSHYYIHIAWG